MSPFPKNVSPVPYRIFHSKLQFGMENTKALAREVNKALRYYKKMGLLHSITTDKGSEFTKFKTIERSLKTPVYFATLINPGISLVLST